MELNKNLPSVPTPPPLPDYKGKNINIVNRTANRTRRERLSNERMDIVKSQKEEAQSKLLEQQNKAKAIILEQQGKAKNALEEQKQKGIAFILDKIKLIKTTVENTKPGLILSADALLKILVSPVSPIAPAIRFLGGIGGLAEQLIHLISTMTLLPMYFFDKTYFSYSFSSLGALFFPLL